MSGDGSRSADPGAPGTQGLGETESVAYLDAPLVESVRQVGASIGAVYLRDTDPGLLRLAVLVGVPLDFFAPWLRVTVATPTPATDAYRDQQLVWVGGQEEMAQAYPRIAVAVPYPFALAALPLTAAHRWGSMLLLWPATHPALPSARERRNITAVAQNLAWLIDARARTRLPLPPSTPRVLATPTLRPEPPQHALAAADFVERLPVGACALDLQGRVTYVSPKAAEVLERTEAQLLGTLPWQSIPWLDDPVYEDRYRAAVISREAVSFTALRAPGDILLFRLYPDASGISVLVNRTDADHPDQRAVSRITPDPTPVRAGRLYQVMHLAAALTETTSVKDVAELVAEQIMPAFDAQACLFYTVEDERLVVAGHRGYPPGAVDVFDGTPLNTTFTAAAQAVTARRAMFFGSPGEIENLYPRLAEITGRRAWAFLPLVAHHSPVGCCVLGYDQEHHFGADERALLTSLAGLIAQAVDRARLYDAQYRLAHGLQQALLPRALPTVPGLQAAARYLPATRGMDIGGDFYDLIPLSATTVAAVIGDIEGHNVAAAALMGQLRTAIRAHTSTGAAPAQVLARTNRLLNDLESDLLASCMYAHLDLARGRVRLANAGHPPPLLSTPGHPCTVADVTPGPLLGSTTDAAYPTTELRFPPGSLLALYTDGLVEAPGTDLEQQIAACARALDAAARTPSAAAPALDTLVDALLAGPTTRAFPHNDDIAVLLLRAEPAGG